MRIKYKIWDTEEKGWAENLFISGCGRTIVGTSRDDFRYVPCIYTGLIDNNGNQIYCGDILAFQKGEFERGDGGADDRMEVYYDNTLARFSLRFFSKYGGEGHTGVHENISDYVSRGAVAIGNINSTPILLNQ